MAPAKGAGSHCDWICIEFVTAAGTTFNIFWSSRARLRLVQWKKNLWIVWYRQAEVSVSAGNYICRHGHEHAASSFTPETQKMHVIWFVASHVPQLLHFTGFSDGQKGLLSVCVENMHTGYLWLGRCWCFLFRFSASNPLLSRAKFCKTVSFYTPLWTLGELWPNCLCRHTRTLCLRTIIARVSVWLHSEVTAKNIRTRGGIHFSGENCGII